MTELESLSVFLDSAVWFEPSLVRDRDKIASIKNHCEKKHDLNFLRSYVLDLLALYDSIVVGLNTGKFQFESPRFSKRPSSSLPRFLGNVLAKVFDSSGNLLEDWCRESVELLLQSLALFKRFKHEALTKAADAASVDAFVATQSRQRPANRYAKNGIRKFWSVFTRDFESFATLGQPGPGSTMDERHPYVPKLTYLDTFDYEFSLMTTDMVQFYDKAFENHTGFKSSRDWFLSSKPGISPSFYRPEPSPILRGVSVPKNAKVSRFITINYVGNTCLGATYRNTVKSLWKAFGITHVLNVDDQSLSHRNLRLYFPILSLLDIEDGSSCFTNSFNREVLPSVFHDYLDFIDGASVKIGDEYVDVNTQLMGDAHSVAILTTHLYFVVLYAMFLTRNHESITRARSILMSTNSTCESAEEWLPAPNKDQILELIEESKSLPINIVGDDMLFPSEFEHYVRIVLKGLGVSINERKSSTRDSNHKESCGSWFLRMPDGSPKRIYPFRCPEYQPKPQRLRNLTSYLHKVEGSTFYLDLVHSFAKTYGKEILRESYTTHQIGCIVGTGLPQEVRELSRDKLVCLSDDERYNFNFKHESADESRVHARFKRRNPTPIVRLGKFVDRSRRSTKDYLRFLKVLSFSVYLKIGLPIRALGPWM